jgi:hypothetical protein
MHQLGGFQMSRVSRNVGFGLSQMDEDEFKFVARALGVLCGLGAGTLVLGVAYIGGCAIAALS